MRAIHVTGPNAADWLETTVPDSDALETYQRMVGGLIEALATIESDRATVFINEEGKIEGLPPTAVWTEPDGTVLDILRGPLVLLGPVNDDGNTTGLTDEALAYIRERVRPAAAHFGVNDAGQLAEIADAQQQPEGFRLIVW